MRPPPQPTVQLLLSLLWPGVQQTLRSAARRLNQTGIAPDVRKTQHRRAGLPRAQKFAGAADFKVALRNFKSILNFSHRAHPRIRGSRFRRRVEQQAHRGLMSAPDQSALLVQLSLTETLFMFDEHQ